MFQQFSPNMLKTYELCPKKFYLKYIKGITMPINDDIFEFGKNIHALASYYLRGENLVNMEKSLNEREKLVWEHLRSIKYFSYKVINTEYNLAVRIGNHFFGGRLDALVKNDNTYYILDYKTGSAPKNAKYDFQTIIYILAVKEFFKTDKITFVYIDLKNNQTCVIDFTQEKKLAYEKAITTICSNIENIQIPEDIEHQKMCDFCEYKKICI